MGNTKDSISDSRIGSGPNDAGEIPYRRGMSATMQDVAAAASVSVITVSRYFRDPDAVHRKTRQRIDRAIKDTGYLPNLSARSLASKRSNVIGVVVPAIDNPVYSDMVRGLSDEFRQVDMNIIIGNTEHRNESESDSIRALMAHRPDGVVLTGVTRSRSTRNLLASSSIPIVETWEMGGAPMDMVVGFDNAAAMYAVGCHLVERGYRKLVVVSGEIEKYLRLQQRLEGLQRAVRGTPTRISENIIELPAYARSGAEAVHRAMSGDEDVDALVCFGDVYAIGAALECARQGIRVPDRIAITGFGDFEHAAMLSPALTTVKVPARRIGEEAAKLLWQALSGRTTMQKKIDVGFELLVRESS